MRDVDEDHVDERLRRANNMVGRSNILHHTVIELMALEAIKTAVVLLIPVERLWDLVDETARRAAVSAPPPSTNVTSGFMYILER